MSFSIKAAEPTYKFPSISGTEINAKGEVIDRPVDAELGFFRSTVGWMSHPKTMFKFIATCGSVGQLWSDSAHIAAASNGFNAAGSLCGALPDAILECSRAVDDVVKGKITTKTGASAFKSVGDFAGLVGGLEKMKIIVVSESNLYIIGVIKNLFSIIGDLFTLAFESSRKSKTDRMPVEKLSPELFSTSKNELWAGRVKAVIALAFHAFLAIGAIFLIPLSPIAVTVVAVVYTISATVHHYMKTHRDDIEKRTLVKHGYGRLAVASAAV